MPYVVLLILLLRGVTLDGSMDGIKYYLYPQWDKLLSSDVWIDAATQIFFSLGPGFGTLLALSSYNKFHNNCYRDALLTSIINCLTSFLAGFVIFSVLGYMAHVLQKDISNVATDGPGLVFIVYPEAIATMKGSVFWSILFFLMLITLGLDSTFGGLEAMLTGLCDEYPTVLRRHREIFVGVVIMFIYACALPTTTYVSAGPVSWVLRQVLQIHLSGGIDQIGGVRWPLALCLFAVFVLVYFSLWKGVRSTGKAVWVTATMPYVVLLILLLRGVTLDGSMDGIKYYLYPQWDKLLSSDVWIDAATQIFFSLGPGFGTLLALSSYNKFHNNCYRDALLTSIINCLTSFLAGFVIFSVLGYMAHVLQKDISNVATDGPGLVFIVYPEAIATMKGSVFWSILFFLMLITLGLDSTFGGLEAMLTGLCDEYPTVLRRHREIFVGVVIMFIYACALPTTTYGGNYIVSLLDTYATATGVLFIVFIESMVVCWFYGANRFSQHVKEMLGHLPGLYWRLCWSYISPLFLFVMFLFAVLRYKELEWEDYTFPRWSIAVGWVLTTSSMCFVPGYILVAFVRTKGTFRERMVICFRPHSAAARKLRQGVPVHV
ncbi:sodium-dependent serotonin transporter [Ixodes scapularis]